MLRGDELLVIAEDDVKAERMLTRQELKRQEHHRRIASDAAHLADEFAAEISEAAEHLTVGATKAPGDIGRCSGDAGEIYGRYTGDIGEIYAIDDGLELRV